MGARANTREDTRRMVARPGGGLMRHAPRLARTMSGVEKALAVRGADIYTCTSVFCCVATLRCCIASLQLAFGE